MYVMTVVPLTVTVTKKYQLVNFNSIDVLQYERNR